MKYLIEHFTAVAITVIALLGLIGMRHFKEYIRIKPKNCQFSLGSFRETTSNIIAWLSIFAMLINYMADYLLPKPSWSQEDLTEQSFIGNIFVKLNELTEDEFRNIVLANKYILEQVPLTESEIDTLKEK